MKDDEFISRFERKIHTLIIGVATIGTVCSVVLDTIHTAPTGVMCAPATNFPTGCSQKPELYGECDANIEKHARNIALLSFCIVGFSFLTVMVIAIAMIHVAIKKSVLYRNISKTDLTVKGKEIENKDEDQDVSNKDEDQDEDAEKKEDDSLTSLRNQGLDRYGPKDVKIEDLEESSSIQLEIESSEKKTESVDKFSSNEESVCIEGVVTSEIDRIQERERQKQDAEELRKLYVKVLSTQALLWIAANFITLAPFFIISYLMLQKNISPEDLPLMLRFSNSIFYPLKGFIHILIFTRPAVMFFRQIRKDHSWFRSFYLIVKAGGEVPPLRVFQLDERYDYLEESIPNDPNIVPVQPCPKIESVPFGFENVASSKNPSIKLSPDSQGDLENLLNEVKEASYAKVFNGSKQSEMSSNNILYHSEADWYHIQGDDEYRNEYPSHYALSFDENGSQLDTKNVKLK